MPSHHKDSKQWDSKQRDSKQRDSKQRDSTVSEFVPKASQKDAAKYARNDRPVPIKSIADRKLKGTLRRTDRKFRDVALRTAQAELLLTDSPGFLEPEGTERTWKFSQSLLKQNVDFDSSKKIFDLRLDELGPYSLDYTRNGRYLLIAGRKGHIASFDWQTSILKCEFQVRETVRDARWLHNETMFALAQKKYVHLYDNLGTEIHCLRHHIDVNRLEFLPYHFLLASVGNAGYLKYQDTSTGKLVAELRTKLGRCNTMSQNPQNAVIHLGHSNGTVSMWSPAMSTPLVKMLCHKGLVQSIAIDAIGRHMATAGLDGQLKIWDLRTYKQLHSYVTPAPVSNISISQRGLLAVSHGQHLSIWKDAFSSKQKEPYMSHLFPASIVQDMHFCPFEDVLGVGHANGISSLIVPGSGEPNFDTFEANPYQTKKQRQESEVHSLLDKIQPEMITLDPSVIGKVSREHKDVILDERKREWEANHPNEKYVPAHKARGKSSSLRRYLRKQTNVVDEKREQVRKDLEKKQAARVEREREQQREMESAGGGKRQRSALDRFVRKH